MVFATSAPRVHELDSTIAVVTVALLIALVFQAQLFGFRRHQAREPRATVVAMGLILVAAIASETGALLGMLARDPRMLTKISATGLVLIFAMVFALLFMQWLEGLREHARERHHQRKARIAERAVEWTERAIAGGAAVVIAAIWWLWLT